MLAEHLSDALLAQGVLPDTGVVQGLLGGVADWLEAAGDEEAVDRDVRRVWVTLPRGPVGGQDRVPLSAYWSTRTLKGLAEIVRQR